MTDAFSPVPAITVMEGKANKEQLLQDAAQLLRHDTHHHDTQHHAFLTFQTAGADEVAATAGQLICRSATC